MSGAGVMTRRSLLAALLAAPAALAKAPPVDALLVGDSLAYQLGPRLAQSMRAKQRRLALDGRGGSSARQWLREGWFRRAVKQHPARIVLVSLGVNCTRPERPKLGDDIEALLALAPAPVLWLLPPPLKMDTAYLREAMRGEAFAPGPLPLESDGIHPTHEGHTRWAELLVARLWPESLNTCQRCGATLAHLGRRRRWWSTLCDACNVKETPCDRL